MAIDSTGVLEIQCIEDRGWLQDLFDGVFEPPGELVCGLSDERQAAEHLPERPLGLLVPGIEAVVSQCGQRRQAANGGCVGPTVVIDHDDQALRLGHCDVIEGLVGHATGQGAIPDDRHRVTRIPGQGMAEGVGKGRGGVAVLDEIVL